MTITLKAAAWVISILLSMAGFASGAEYFVGIYGNDASDGLSPETAWRTINRGIRDLKPGDILTITPGIYDEQVTMTIVGDADKAITIRAQKPGLTIIKASRAIKDFAQVEGKRFVWAVRVEHPVYNIIESDTNKMLLRAPGLIDMDRFRASWYYDGESKILYIHSSDGLPAFYHGYEATARPGHGMTLMNSHNVIVDGLSFVGHYIEDRAGWGFGMAVRSSSHCEIRNCIFINNGGGIIFRDGSKRCNVAGCLFMGNQDPLYGELAQLYVSALSENISAVDNIVLDADTHGIRFYNNARDNIARGNIIKNSRIGLYYKATAGERSAIDNVVVGSSYFNFGSGENPGPFGEKHNTFQSPNQLSPRNIDKLSPSTLEFIDENEPRFCDPDNLDYRLQADSPFRKKLPDGADQGAYQFQGNVFFVSADGNDDADGMSVANSWRTIEKACSDARPGSTVYILPGEYLETLRPARSGEEGAPIIFRSRGKGITARITAPEGQDYACDLSGISFVKFEGIHFAGKMAGMRLSQSNGVIVSESITEGIDGAGIEIGNVSGFEMRSCAALGKGTSALNISGRISSLILVNSLIQSGGPAINMSNARAEDIYLDFNCYHTWGRGPLFIINNQHFNTLEEWKAVSRLDYNSISAQPKVDHEKKSLSPDSLLVGMGIYGRSIGPYPVESTGAHKAVTDIEIRQVTSTSACISWWTPGASTALKRSTEGWWEGPTRLARIIYGRTPECRDGALDSFGDVFHSLTVLELRPSTRYYFRIEIADSGHVSEVNEFTTAPAEWRAPSRTLFVSPAGDDRNDGFSPNTAFRTLFKASEEARAGDTVVVADGVYCETISPLASGVEGAPIVFKSENLNGAILDGSNFYRPSAVYLPNKQHIIIDGFVMRRFAPKNLGRRGGMDYAQVVAWNSRNITIRNCAQWGFGNYGFGGIVMNVDGLTLENNVMAGFTSAWSGRGCGSVKILNNTFYVPAISNLNFGAENLFMKNNLFFGKSRQKYPVEFFSIPAGKADVDYNVYVFNNDDDHRHISGPETPAEGEAPAGIEAWRRYSGYDMQGKEISVDSIKFRMAPTVNTDDPEFNKFGGPITRGEISPRLEMFDPLPDSPLNTAGEEGKPVGARSILPVTVSAD